MFSSLRKKKRQSQLTLLDNKLQKLKLRKFLYFYNFLFSSSFAYIHYKSVELIVRS